MVNGLLHTHGNDKDGRKYFKVIEKLKEIAITSTKDLKEAFARKRELFNFRNRFTTLFSEHHPIIL